MTLKQFTGYLQAATAQINHEQAMLILAVAVGAQGDGDAIEETIEKLTEKEDG